MTRFLRFIIILNFLFLSAFAQAQNKSIVKGVIADSALQKALPFATVSLVNAKDSTLYTFTRTDSIGAFQLKSVIPGNYLISVSYVGYYPTWQPVKVSAGTEVIDAGNVFVKDLKSLGNVTVTAKRPPVVVNNDTLEFNAENFVVQPNAVVEDMLKKMPGVTVDNEGVVRVNGQRINRVLVNGKEFFTGDPKMATKNLPADAVDKVQVFDKQSDRAAFTGVDDGNSEKTINLKLKKDRDNALFGKATAGAGTDQRYDGQLNLNRFKGEKQMSLIGMGNNTNRQGFSFQDALSFSGDMMRNMRGSGGSMVIRTGGLGDDNNGLPIAGMGASQPGIAKTYAGGMNYNNSWNKRKTSLSASYILTDQSIETIRDINRENILPGNAFNYLQNSKTVRDNLQHRLNVALDHTIDSSTSIKYTSSLTLQDSKTNTQSNYASATTASKKINDGYSNSTNESDGFNWRNNILLRKRLAKKGRTISADLNFNLNNSDGDGTLKTQNLFYDANSGNVNQQQLLDQVNSREVVNRSFGATLIYTEPLGKRSLLEISGFYNNNNGKSDKKTYDYNGVSGKHDVLNAALSNNFESIYEYTGGSATARYQSKKLTMGGGASLQQSTLKSVVNKASNIRLSFTDVLPSANVTYRFNNYKNIRFDYNTSTNQPSVTQLQPVPDISDPLNIRLGNPSLNREYNHNASINYFTADPATRKNFFAMLSLSRTANAIVYNDMIDPATGIRSTKPVNANGVYNVFASANAGFPIRKLKSRIEYGGNITRSNNISYINDKKNTINNLSITPNVSWNYSRDSVIDLRVSARIGYNDAQYSLQEQLNTKYWQQTYSAEIINYLPGGIILTNNFSYIKTTGRTAGYNTSVPLWNATLAKGFMKNKRAEFKLSAFDLLNQNIGISRNANQNYIEDIRYNVLKRYFLLSFTYSLNKSGLNTGPRVMIRTM